VLWPQLQQIEPKIAEQIKTDAIYAGYLDRQQAEIKRFKQEEDRLLPGDLNYSQISGLSTEVTEKLNRIRPTSLGQASRIEGITPGALTMLMHYVRRGSEKRPA